MRASADERPPPADVVVANILSSPLKLLAPVLVDLVRPGGALVTVLAGKAAEDAVNPTVISSAWMMHAAGLTN